MWILTKSEPVNQFPRVYPWWKLAEVIWKVHLAVIRESNIVQAGACGTVTCGEHNAASIYKISCAVLLHWNNTIKSSERKCIKELYVEDFLVPTHAQFEERKRKKEGTCAKLLKRGNYCLGKQKKCWRAVVVATNKYALWSLDHKCIEVESAGSSSPWLIT